MNDDKEKATTVGEKALPPLDQVPPAPEMPVLKRKAHRLDTKTETVEKPAWLEMPGGDEEICGMPPNQVFTDLEMCERGCKEFARQSATLNKRMEEIRQALKHIDKTSTLLNHHQLRLRAKNPTNPNDAVRQFQRRSQEMRLLRRDNALAFIGKGTNITDVRKAMNVQSPLDLAHGRKSGFGQKRPQAGLLKTVK
jgi:hypothetical protein